MSTNKYWRTVWVTKVFAQAVSLFHEARKEPENAEVPLGELARQCANTAFTDNANTIVGDKETTAKAFMAYCREHFEDELQTAIGARIQADLAAQPAQEARAN